MFLKSRPDIQTPPKKVFGPQKHLKYRTEQEVSLDVFPGIGNVKQGCFNSPLLPGCNCSQLMHIYLIGNRDIISSVLPVDSSIKGFIPGSFLSYLTMTSWAVFFSCFLTEGIFRRVFRHEESIWDDQTTWTTWTYIAHLNLFFGTYPPGIC